MSRLSEAAAVLVEERLFYGAGQVGRARVVDCAVSRADLLRGVRQAVARAIKLPVDGDGTEM